MNKIPLLISIFLFGTYFSLRLLHVNYWISLSVFLIPIILLIVSFSIRKKLKFKSWFLSPKNILIERNSRIITSEIESVLLFEKLLEVIEDSEFKLFDSDQSSNSLLCGTTANIITWGENVYIFINEKKNNSSEVLVVATTIFGSNSWGRNDKNHRSFFDQLENSLTV